MEQEWFPRFDVLLATSQCDVERIRNISPGSRIVLYPNALPAAALPRKMEENVVAFSGNLEFHPNVQAVRYFRAEIWPLLRDRWPQLIWRLIGKNPEAVQKYTTGDVRIQVTGPVSDAIDELAASKVVVVPLLAGSGTRVKILEAWAAGRAVVSTRVGAEGLPARHGENLLLADDPARFADSVSSVLASPQLQEKLGGAGRVVFESEFTWHAAWSRLDL
jgi:glycosyltransferase involved in cell wall biosynthesis